MIVITMITEFFWVWVVTW